MEEIILIIETKLEGFIKMNATINNVPDILTQFRRRRNGNLVSWQVVNRYSNTKHDLIKTIDREYEHMKDRGWDRIFLFFDLHGTVIKPNFEVGNTNLDYYPYAKETLQLLSKQINVDLNIYTCSHEDEIIEYQKKFKEDGIIFKYVNENPDVQTNGYGNYDIKPYMNILFEDKAGFFGEKDWEPIYNHFVKMHENNLVG
jgi:hypothetical protein